MNARKKPKQKRTKTGQVRGGKERENIQFRKNEKRQSLILGLIIAGLGFILYANTINHDYVLDDHSVIKSNWLVQRGTDGISTLLKTSYRYGYWNSPGTLYRPLSLVMFAIEWELSPDDPVLHHIINVLLYALTGFFLFIVLRKLLSDYNLAIPFIISLLFIAHPLHTEVVANIKSRDEIVSFLLVLLSFNFLLNYLKSNSVRTIILSVILYFLAFLSKESAITMLAVVPLMLYFFKNITLKKILIITGMFSIGAVAYLLLRQNVLGDVKSIESVSVMDNLLMSTSLVSQKLATAVYILGKYFLLLIFPHPLVCDYSYNQIPVINFTDIKAILSLLFYLGIFAWAIIRFKNKTLDVFGILFYLITLSLYANIFIIIGSSFAERFLFVPSLGFIIILVFLIFKILKKEIITEKAYTGIPEIFTKNKGVWGIIAVIFILYSFKTIDRNRDWKDNFTMYAADVKSSPNSARTHYYHGLELMKQKALNAGSEQEKNKYLDMAINEFKTASGIYKYYADAYDQTGLAYYRKNDHNKAIEYYELALKYNPSKPITYSNLGAIYFGRKDYEKAIEVYKEAIKYNPRFADAHMNLGSTYATIGKMKKAIQAFLKGLEYNPNSAPLNYYTGVTYQQIGNINNAKKYLDRAYRLDPSLRK